MSGTSGTAAGGGASSPATPAPPLAVPAANVGIMVEKCGYSHSSNADPILMPEMSGMSMLHNFFGNTGTAASSTAATLRGGPTT